MPQVQTKSREAALPGEPSSDAPDSRKEAAALFAEALAASRLRAKDNLVALISSCADVASCQDSEGRSCLHYAAEHCEGLEEILAVPGVKSDIKDKDGNFPLHFAAAASCPMAAYALAKCNPGSCLARNRHGKTAAAVAKEKNFGEVLNAMLLACCSTEANPKDSCPEALEAIEMLLDEGAVPDTWAPNGNSALMMAASADSPKAIAMLLKRSAQINMKDTLGRTALMFAAGNDAQNALEALMDAGGQEALSLQDNRGNNVTKYACGDGTKQLVERRFAELEAAATAHQAALLADLAAEELSAAKPKRNHRGKKKKKGAKGQGDIPEAEEAEAAAPNPAPADGTEASAGCRGAEPDLPSPAGQLEGFREASGSFQSGDAALDTAAAAEQSPAETVEHISSKGKAEAYISIKADATALDSHSLPQKPQPSEKIGSSNDSQSRQRQSSQPMTDPSLKNAAEAPETIAQAPGNSAIQKLQGLPKDAEGAAAAALGSGADALLCSRPDLSQGDREAIEAALRGNLEPAELTERTWQEVRKPVKGACSKPPLAKRCQEKFFDPPHSLLPSSSSASLDSLGDSTASGVSGRSLPSGALHLVQHLAGAPQPPAFQASTISSNRNRRQLPKADPITAAPGRSGTAPETASKPATSAAASLSWANVVQGRAMSNSEATPQVQADERGTELAVSSSAVLEHAPTQAEPPPPLQAPRGSCICQESECPKPANTPSPHGKEVESENASAELVPAESLKEENWALRQQLLAAAVQQQQLKSQLVRVQQEHRLMLQKAVEDTARNILAQQHQRYRQTVEALQLLLVQAHCQLQQQGQLQGPLRAALAGLGAASIAAQQPNAPSGLSTAGSLRPAGFASSPNPTLNGSSLIAAGLGSQQGEKRMPGDPLAWESEARDWTFGSSSCGALGQESTGCLPSPMAVSDPWATKLQAGKEAPIAAPSSRPVLPSLDSIWGPVASDLSSKSFNPPSDGEQHGFASL